MRQGLLMSRQSGDTANVLHLLNGEQYSGLERVIDHLAEQASQFGYRLHLVFLKEGTMADRMQSRRAELYSVPMRSRFDLSIVPRILKIAKGSSCRLVHSHTVRSALLAFPVSRMAHLPWMHHVHSPALHESEIAWLNRANAVIESCLLPRATRLLPVSQGLARYLKAQYRVGENQMEVVPNGVQADSAPPRAGARHSPTIGAVGLFRPRKGIETLLAAVQRLAQWGLDFSVKLIGEFVDTDYENSIRQMATNLKIANRIEFSGFCSDVPRQLARVDVFVMPSLYGEGMPMALLEAMGMECAVVASDIDGINELVGDGVSGLMTPPGNDRALAEAIRRLMDDPAERQRMAQAARARQQAEYSVEAMSRRVFALYDQLLKPEVAS